MTAKCGTSCRVDRSSHRNPLTTKVHEMTNEAVHPPVVVLGNGPVGQTTALMLARWGIRSLILDNRPERDPIGSKAICQQRDVLEAWDAIGVGRQLADEGVTWGCARTFYRDDEVFAQTFVDQGASSFPPFVNISQARTEELLDVQIAASDLVEVRWNHHVDGVRHDDSRTYVDVTTPQGHVVVEADYCVVALGSRAGRIREQLGISFEGRSFDDKFLICDIRADLPDWAHERRFYFDPEWNPGRQVLIHPCPDSTYRIDWQVPGDYDLAAEEASGDLDRRIRQIIGDVEYTITWKSVYRFHSRLADRMRMGRVLLAGDAAHVVSPFGARGLNSGVADAENAAWKLAFVIKGWASADLLETYHDERHAAASENIDVTTATMDFLVPQNKVQSDFRTRILSACASQEQLRSHVDSGRLAEPYWYTTSPIITPDPGYPFAGRPPKGSVPQPGPGILLPDTPIDSAFTSGATRLRQIARDGLLLLVGEAVDAGELRDRAATATPVPTRVERFASLDNTGALIDAMRPAPHEIWVIRPDSYVSAVLDSRQPELLGPALQRAVAASRR
ncbi:FAD-dependent monooxygenase [Rhodococcus erythropolis]|uniref:FAD-dependent monooxygenase n=1 Tax=Rhodococcus erythropolis TaxID=1833 RepID=UPI00210A2687|nr:FAD-dependent monooxygenase [Rhodococcus erythropolis]